MRVICAWCRRVLRKGIGPVSHGICPECARSLKMPAPCACKICGSDDVFQHDFERHGVVLREGGCFACEARYVESAGRWEWTPGQRVRAYDAAQDDAR